MTAAILALAFSACGTAEITTNKPAANNSNTLAVANSNQTNADKTGSVSNTTSDSSGRPAANKTSNSTTPADNPEASDVQGELQVGKSESVILYVGMESGDYAAYCFANDSEAGRAILAACKDKGQCEVKGKVDHDAGCKVPGLEADLSASGKILKVDSVKSLGRK